MAFLIFVDAFAEGFHRKWIDQVARIFLGHIQIHALGFFESYLSFDVQQVIENPEEIVERVSQVPGVVAASPRLDTFAFGSTGEYAHTMRMLGIDPLREGAVTGYPERIVAGEYLSPDPVPGAPEILLGEGMAKYFRVQPGDRIFVTVQTFTGDVNYEVFYVRGIFRTANPDVDNFLVLVHLKDLQRLMAQDVAYFQGKVTGIVVLVEDAMRAKEVAQRIREALADTPYEVRSWEEMAPDLVQLLNLDRAFLRVLLFVFLLVSALATSNTVLMAVLERIREFGVMLALGFGPSDIFRLILLESAIVGFLGALLGLAGGTLLSLYFRVKGLDLQAFAHGLGWMLGEDTVVYFVLRPHFAVEVAVTLLLVVLVAGLYPAWRARSLKPVDALRYV